MTSRTFVLTNSPYTRAQISLASFVPNIKQPHQDAERPYQVEASDYEVQSDAAFDLILRHGSESHLRVLVTRLLSLGAGRDKEDTFQVTAHKGYTYSLTDPKKLFKKIVFGDDAGEDIQRWLEDCKQSKLKPRFVVGYRTFVDSQLAVDHDTGVNFSAKASVPVSEALGDATGLMSVGAEADKKVESEARVKMAALGERIYAICYRKIDLAYRQGHVVATLAQDNVWDAFAGPARGEEEGYDADDLYVEANLEEMDDGGEGEGGSEMFSLQGGGSGEVLESFAVLSYDSKDWS